MNLPALFIAILAYGSWIPPVLPGIPNIIFIFTDDQDLLHGSVDHQKAIQKHLAAEGTVFITHFATVAVCCPSRVSLMRGQAAHNTNNTAINTPGGGYPKFVASGENEKYLPHWLSKAGYKAKYIGKLFNGNSLLNYSPGPQGWRHIDVLLDPYINTYNTVVMSENGDRPTLYQGFHQSDVIMIKALARLQKLLDEEDPFFLMIAPTAPHVENLRDAPTLAKRHLDSFAKIKVPRTPNFNPGEEYQKQKPSWLRNLELLNSTQIAEIDHLHQRRVEALQSVDDIVEDVVTVLKDKDAIDNTYIIYSTDQGYHLGTHRHAGKLTPYREDTNIPLIVRGPGVHRGAVSNIPSTVTDFAPTFLDIAGLAKRDQPSFLDGASGAITNTELYNTLDDPYELKNLANSGHTQIKRVKSRLNALLLVMKSCTKSTCRDPWSVIQPPSHLRKGKKVKTLDDALESKYDDYYSSFPLVTIDECLEYQYAPNERPFWPPEAEFGLGLEYRNPTDNFMYPDPEPVKKLAKNDPLGGGWDQRNVTLEQLLSGSRDLTDEELEQGSD
ncbi:arylsulfatase precursor [Fusarium denticulatum]|uniref:Arylsulfatase n=1 Tax=Fusarium denticulatum TaxID=48507 RepID=A0A8H5WYG7_9HYPO|nr:arylsulfatase precursor [Fusarium denticulatum]